MNNMLSSNPFLVKDFVRLKNKNPMYNNMVYHYFEELHNLVLSSIEIEGLPDEIEEFFLYDVIFWHGQALFIYDDVLNTYAVTSMSEAGGIDAYGHGFIRYSYATPNYLKQHSKWDSVIFRDRPTGISYARDIMCYAETLANLWLTREINLNAMKTPVVIKAPKEVNLSYQLMAQDIQNYVPIIKTDNDMDLDRIQTLDLNAPVIFDKIEEQIHKIKMEALSFIGFDVSAVEKKERVQTADAQQNQEQNFGNRTMRLACYERSCKQANALFGLDLKPRFRTEAYIDARNFLYMEVENDNSNGDQEEQKEGGVDEE